MALVGSDAIDDLKTAFKERFSNPVLGAFTLSWLLVNYRIFFVLFSGKSPAWRFAYIDEMIYPDTWSFLWKIFLMPASLAAFYIYLVPRFVKPIYKHMLRVQRDVIAIRMESEGAQILTQERADELYAEIEMERKRLALGLQESEALKKEADIKIRKSSADLQEEKLNSKERVEAAVKRAATAERNLADARREVVNSHAVIATAFKMHSLTSNMSEMLMANTFEIDFQGFDESKHEIRFGEDGEVLSEESEFTKWSIAGTRLSLFLDTPHKRCDLDFDPEQRLFRGYVFGGPVVLRIKN